MDKTLRKVTDFEEQDAETYRYWQSVSVGERLSAVCDASLDAYASKGLAIDPDKKAERNLVRIQHP
jgi:hypothetical protein